MDRPAALTGQRVFFSTGRREDGLGDVEGAGLVPASIAPLRDLARLRHDFPLVLARDERGPGPVHSLSALVDSALRTLAPLGMEGERLRRLALRVEREIRARAAAGARGTLSELWQEAAATVGEPAGEGADEVLRHLAGTLEADGDVVACDAAMPARLLVHCHELAQAGKARTFRALVDRLCTRLHDILRAARAHSAAGATAEALRASVGAPSGDEFDFEAMSRLVSRRLPRDELSDARRHRIEWALRELRSQRFYPDPKAPDERIVAYGFHFLDCATAAEAFRQRLEALVGTMRAIAVAELEADGRYDAALHDDFFEAYGEHNLTADDLALFPDYLVCIPPGANAAAANANLMEMLSSGLPVKVMVETDEAMDDAAIGAGHYAFGVRANRLAMTATSLGGVFVLQAPASELFRLRGRIAAGLEHRGPALFSVFAGADATTADLAPYLTAAAALRSRAFPSFSYDPLAGDNMAARFSFGDDPDPEADWPISPVEYSDERMQRVVEQAAFTLADFALCDRRCAPRFAIVPGERWNASMVPLAEWLALPREAAQSSVPYLLAADAGGVVHRVLVDERLAAASRRALVLWHRLQELGGIHNSYAERALAAAKAQVPVVEAKAEAEVPATVAATPETQPAADRTPGEPWIETARCPSCNECQLINDKLFLYDANKQAYLGDLKSGTYRQMVEAAESCQVSIIHPGKPWNPNEPGLEELLERAKPFQ